MLGLDTICPKSELAEISGYGIGLLQETCAGNNIMMKGRNARIRITTPAFLKSISDLNLLDVVCHEMDHSPNNYNVILDDGLNTKTVIAFDNNGIGTFFLRGDISFQTFLKCSPYVTKGGRINRSFVSLKTAKKLNQMSFAVLYRRLRKTLGLLPVVFTYLRIIRLKKSFSKQKKKPRLPD